MNSLYQPILSNIPREALRPEPLEMGLYIFASVILPPLLSLFMGRYPKALKWFLYTFFLFIAFNCFHSFFGRNRHLFYWPLSILAFIFLILKKPDLKKLLRWFHAKKWRTHSLSLLALVFFALRIIPCFCADETLSSLRHMVFNVEFTSEEMYAPLLGLIPYFNFEPQYTKVLGVLSSPYFYIFGTSTKAFSIFCIALSSFIFFSCYQWISYFWKNKVLTNLFFIILISFATYNCPGFLNLNAFTYYAVGPFRYFGVFLVAFFFLRYLKTQKGVFSLGVVSALVFFNNLDFGLPAAVGAFIALCVNSFFDAKLLSHAKLFLGGVLTFILGYFGSLSLWMGALPFQETYFSEFQKAFGILGIMLLPMPAFGLHVMALSVAPLMVLRSGLYWRQRWGGTGMKDNAFQKRMAALLFFGITSIGASTYYVGRSHDLVLPAIFLLLAFNSILFLRLTFRERNHPIYRPLFLVTITALALLIPETFRPVNPLQVFNYSDPSFLNSLEKTKAWVEKNVPKDSKPMFLIPFGNRIALETGRKNSSMYVESGSIILHLQMHQLIGKIKKEKPTHFLLAGLPEIIPYLKELGYKHQAEDSFGAYFTSIHLWTLE